MAFCLISVVSLAQTYNGTIAPAMTFLDMASGSNASGMQAATGSGLDVMPYYNTAAIPMQKERIGVSVGYNPFLTSAFNDAHNLNAMYYQKTASRDAFFLGLNYNTIGNVFLKDEYGNESAFFKPHDVSAFAGYVKFFADGNVANNEILTGSGLSFLGRYFNSTTLSGVDAGSYGVGSNVGGVAVNIAFYSEWSYKNRENQTVSWGITLNNLGGKVNYFKDGLGEKNFLPASIRVGIATKKYKENSRLTFAADISKLLVPSIPERDSAGVITSGKIYDRSVVSSWVSSLADAPGGISEEIKEMQLSAGGEYFYNNKLFIRTGINLQNKQKGNNSSLTFGGGYRTEYFGNGFDFNIGYRQSFNVQSDLGNNFFIGLNYKFNNE